MTFLMFSASLAILPYLAFVFFGGNIYESASTPGTSAYNARLLVNNLVAILIGGPHMYATVTRTFMDNGFRARWKYLMVASLVIPISVITMAIASYETYVWLLTAFFAMASIHALQQIVWLTDAYNTKVEQTLTWKNRLIDYAVVLTSLYPAALYRMVDNSFVIGPVQLKYSQFIGGWYWLVWLAGAAFAVALALFVSKSYAEYRAGLFNLPKTVLITITVMLMILAPLFPNLDTAFQGINAWHSFQYLAITWYANSLRQAKGARLGFFSWLGLSKEEGRSSGGLGIRDRLRELGQKIDGGSNWLPFYLLCIAFVPFSGFLIVASGLIWPNVHFGLPGADETYTYIGILSVLLVHYAYDALLFFNPKSITENVG